MENPKFQYQPRILASSDDDIRFKGSSGGVISQIIKYLFDTKEIKSAIGFKFSGIELFEPYLFYRVDDYIQSGSIYHDINIYKFLHENIKDIQSPVLITCLPCQIQPIKRLLQNNKIDSVIVSLVCSSQLDKEATYYFLEKNDIDISSVKEFRYRGNGWPSGIQIKTTDKNYFFHNNTSKWMDVFHSQIFTMKKCFSCKDTFGLNADFSIADPWLDRYINSDKIGSSIVVAHTQKGEALVKDMIFHNSLAFLEDLSQEEVVLSQRGTLIKKYIYLKYKKYITPIIKTFKSSYYKKNFYYISKIHRVLFFKFIAILKRIEGLK